MSLSRTRTSAGRSYPRPGADSVEHREPACRGQAPAREREAGDRTFSRAADLPSDLNRAEGFGRGCWGALSWSRAAPQP